MQASATRCIPMRKRKVGCDEGAEELVLRSEEIWLCRKEGMYLNVS